MLNFTYIIILLPLFVSFFWGIIFAIHLFSKANNPKKHLFFFMLSTFISFMSGVAFFFKNYQFYSLIYIPVVFFALSQFPSFYVYFNSLTNKKKFSVKIYVHYIYPTVAMLSALIIHVFLFSKEENLIFVSKYLTGIEVIDQTKFKIAFYIDRFYKISFIIGGVFYYILTKRRIKEHRKITQNYFSNLDAVNLDYMLIINILLFLSLLGGVFFHAVNRSLFVQTPYLLCLTYVPLSLFIFMVGYYGNTQKIIFTEDTNCKQQEINKTNTEIIKQKLLLLMTENKLFLKTDISLADLATEIGTNRTYLSKIINEEFDLNFNKFINTYRIEYSKEYLNSNSEINLTDLAEICGFNSYSTFNRFFKNTYGVSPSEYQNKIFGEVLDERREEKRREEKRREEKRREECVLLLKCLFNIKLRKVNYIIITSK